MYCSLICVCLVHSVSSGSDSDSDKSNKSDASWCKNIVKEDQTLVAEPDSDDSSAGEEDFNPFGNSGSEDEGIIACLYIQEYVLNPAKHQQNETAKMTKMRPPVSQLVKADVYSGKRKAVPASNYNYGFIDAMWECSHSAWFS